MKNPVESLKAWNKARRFKAAKEILAELIRQKDPDIYQQIALIAQEMADKMVIGWLDRRKLNHCRLCPNTAPLVKCIDGGYLCKPHADVVGRLPEIAAKDEAVLSNVN